MKLKNELQGAGLRKNEAEVYVHLLEKGGQAPPEIAKATGIARTNTYYVLQSLTDKGLVEKVRKGGRYSYIVRDPSAMLEYQQQKITLVEKIQPKLQAIYKSSRHKPVVKFYEGLEEVRSIYMQTLEAESIYTIGATEKLDEVAPKFFKSYKRNLKKKGILVYDILEHEAKDASAKGIQETLGALHSARFLPKGKEMVTDILIWNENVALIVLEKPIVGTVLTNKYLADTFATMHKVMWENLGK